MNTQKIRRLLNEARKAGAARAVAAFLAMLPERQDDAPAMSRGGAEYEFIVPPEAGLMADLGASKARRCRKKAEPVTSRLLTEIEAVVGRKPPHIALVSAKLGAGKEVDVSVDILQAKREVVGVRKMRRDILNSTKLRLARAECKLEELAQKWDQLTEVTTTAAMNAETFERGMAIIDAHLDRGITAHENVESARTLVARAEAAVAEKATGIARVKARVGAATSGALNGKVYLPIKDAINAVNNGSVEIELGWLRNGKIPVHN